MRKQQLYKADSVNVLANSSHIQQSNTRCHVEVMFLATWWM